MNSTNTPYPYLNDLNEIQRNAVSQADGPIMVIAGPGSGKTRVLTYKIAHLIKLGVAPWNILSLTFTNKAAREMKDRIENLIGGSANRIWAGTFHSIFARILRVEAHRIGYPNDFSIYDTDDSKSVINQIVKQLSLDKKKYANGALRSRISSLKSNLITPKMYATNEEYLSQDRMSQRPMFYKVYTKYTELLKRAGAMDFDDLLLQMFRLLFQNPDDIRTKYQQQFQYLLVDEFQDTNYLQYEIIKLLVKYPNSGENICIVGDDAQSIYSFRGATIENILQFNHDFADVKTFKLEQNYRSTPFIIDAANEIITYNKNQIQKKIWTHKEEGNKIKLIKGITDTEEGKRVADSIIEQKNRYNLSNKNICILYRTNSQSRVFEEHLRRYNIQYKIYGGLSFYQRKEIKDLLAYCRLAVNTKDDEALKRVINYPRRGIGSTTIDKLLKIADDNETSIWNCLTAIEFKGKAKVQIVNFIKMIKSFQLKAKEANAYEAALHILKKSGISDLLKSENTMESQSRQDNINALLDGIQEFVEDDVIEEGEEITEDRSLSQYLQNISLMTDQDNEDKESTDYVTLMSIHSAKGLEFKSVFVVGLEENLFPSFQSLNDPASIDEERRLFYVAITRAEEILTLCYASSRYQYGSMRYNDPSRFIEEISDDKFESVVSLTNRDRLSQPKKVGKFPPRPVHTPKNLKPLRLTNFKASPTEALREGMTIMHQKFGKGKILSIDDRWIASIKFDRIVDTPEKRIMLKYAKLQIVED